MLEKNTIKRFCSSVDMSYIFVMKPIIIIAILKMSSSALKTKSKICQKSREV